MKINKKLTLSDLAKLAGVSTSTFSRALNDNPVIKKETRQRLQALAKEHNYSLNAAASRLRTQKTQAVAVILNLAENTEQGITDPFLLGLVGELNQALNQQGYELLLSNSHMASDDWANYFIQGSRADGLIVVGQGKDDERLCAAADAGAPMIVWGDSHPTKNYSVVGSDNRLGGRLAAQHLIDGGYKRIVFLGDPDHAEMGQRHMGYCDALKRAGMHCDPELTLAIDLTSQAAYSMINQTILQRGLVFDAIFACSDMVALGALKALKERYINIPQEVGIVGFDDIALAELLHPSLTTVRQDTRLAAQVMVQQLMLQLAGKQPHSKNIDIALVKRNSSR